MAMRKGDTLPLRAPPPDVIPCGDLDASAPTTCVSLREIALPAEDVALGTHEYDETMTLEERPTDAFCGSAPIGEGILAAHVCVSAELSASVAASFPHELTHKPMSQKRDACLRGELKNMKPYSGSISRPVKDCCGIVAMDYCSFYEHGVTYARSGDTIA